MIEVGAVGLAVLLCAVALCTASGLAISRCLLWSRPAVEARLPIAVGVALGPFLFGMVAALALAVLSGASHSVHLLAVFFALVTILATALVLGRGAKEWRVSKSEPTKKVELILVLAWILCGLAVLFIATFTPLTQNDSLEYATVGRILFETRSLWSYPVLDPETNSSGFFGPWTHPPLYVASIYLASIVQGNVDVPGAMRLVSPWFFITASGVVYALGALVNRMTGLSAAIFFLSTPLLFLGAGSALLDAMFVSAFALLLAAIVGVEARPVLRGGIVGAVAGIGLWTHSVAILFLPLMLTGLALYRGLQGLRTLLPEAATAVAVTLVVGVWHYGRNIVLFGTPVSDNPAVFALPELHWDDYFLINRGLGTTASMIQYGLLKGWFAPEAFGITYWAMAVGFAIVLVAAMRGPLWQSVWRGTATHSPSTMVLHMGLGLFLVYTFGAVVSVALGMDIMVKNERYVLVMQSIVAFGAGYGFVAVLGFISNFRFGHVVQALGVLAFVAGALLQAMVFTGYAVARTGQTFAEAVHPNFAETLSRVGEYVLTDYMRTNTPDDALLLSIKPADMYYADRRMISYLDERLIPFYREENPSEAVAMLRQLGITHVHVPDYGIPPLYNSTLHEILRSPALSDLLISTDRGQVYALHPDDKSEGEPIDISPSARPWTREQVFFLGGRRRIGAASIGQQTDLMGNENSVELPFGLFERNITTSLQVGGPGSVSDAIAVEPSSEIALDLQLSGSGLTLIYVDEHMTDEASKDGTRPATTMIATLELTSEQAVRSFSRRFRVSEKTEAVSFRIEQKGRARIIIRSAMMAPLR